MNTYRETEWLGWNLNLIQSHSDKKNIWFSDEDFHLLLYILSVIKILAAKVLESVNRNDMFCLSVLSAHMYL